MTIQIRETGALRFPALAMRGNAASAAELDALEAEVVAARSGEASLDVRIDSIDAVADATNAEVVAARGGQASLDARLDLMDVADAADIANAQLADMPGETVKGRPIASSAGSPADLTRAQLRALVAPITSAEIAADTILATNIATGAVGTAEIASGAVTGVKIPADAITGGHIADASILNAHLTVNCVQNVNYANSSITTDKIANATIVGLDIAALTIERGNLKDGIVNDAKLADLAVTTIKIADDAVTAEKIATGAVGTAEIASGAVTGVKIPADAIVGGHISDSAILNAHLTVNCVHTANIAIDSITTDRILGGSVTGIKIAANTISGGNIIDGTVQNTELAFMNPGTIKGRPSGSGVGAPQDIAVETLIGASPASLDNRNRSLATAQRADKIVNLAALNMRDNIIIGSPDQSNGNSAAESYPAIITTAIPGAWMLGSSAANSDTRPENLSGANWTRLGGVTALQGMKGATRDGTTVMTTAAAAALTPGQSNPGQNHIVSLCAGLRPWLDDYHGQSTVSTIELYGIACGEGGQAMAGLGKSTLDPAGWAAAGSIDRWSKLVQGLDYMCDAVEALGGTRVAQVALATSCQGESEMLSKQTYEYYKDVRNRYYIDMNNEITGRLPTQTRPCIKYIIFPGGSYTRPDDINGKFDNAVCRALLDLTWERQDCIGVMPYYHTWDKGNHHTANAHLAWGIKLAEAVLAASVERWRFRCLQPYFIETSGTNIDIHIPTETPLKFKQCAFNGAFIDLPNKGFAVGAPVFVAGGSSLYPISSVTIIHPTIIRIAMVSAPPSDAVVTYANNVAGIEGMGNVFNSKRLTPLLKYTFLTGMYGPDFSTLNGTEIDTADALVPFAYPCNWERTL